MNTGNLSTAVFRCSLFLTAGLAMRAEAGVVFFTDPAAFQVALQNAGKVEKTFWDFKPDFLQDVEMVKIEDNLNILTHFNNAPGVWSGPAGNLWPEDFDNITFSANVNPQGTFQKPTDRGLLYLKPPAFGINNNALVANNPADSFDILSGPPAGDNHTALGLELLSISTTGASPVFHITVYDKNEQEKGKFIMDWTPTQKLFLGILATDGHTIGRVDIWDQAGGQEGISSIAAYIPSPGSLALLGLAGLISPRRRRR